MCIHDPSSFYPKRDDRENPFVSLDVSSTARIAFAAASADPDLATLWEKINFGPVIRGEDGIKRRVVIVSFRTEREDDSLMPLIARWKQKEKLFFLAKLPQSNSAEQESEWRVVGQTSLRDWQYAPDKQDRIPAPDEITWLN